MTYPVAADGRAFVVHRRPRYPDGSEVVAVSIRSGRILWRHDLGAEASSAALGYGGGRLYVLESDHFPPGDVYDAAGGALLGRMRADLSPAFSGDLGVFPDTRRPGDDDRYGHKLVARSLSSGRIRWRFGGDGYLDSAPLIASGILFVGSGSGRVYGVSLRSGRTVWRGSAGAPVPAPSISGITGIAAAEGTLLVPAKGRLIAYR